jgi:hypothetical protein
MWHTDDPDETLLLTFVGIYRGQLIDAGLLAPEELDDMAAALVAPPCVARHLCCLRPLLQA